MRTLWRVDKNPTPVSRGTMPSEKLLEDMLEANLRILSPDWMFIGRQVTTGTGFIDILALARDGSLVVIELKKSKTSRDVVSQTLDYLSWASTLEPEEVAELFHERHKVDIAQKFTEQFGTQLDVDQVNTRQIGVIVASEPDASTERIVAYLAQQGLAMNLNTFEVFTEGNQQFLSPNWTVDLAVTQANVNPGEGKGPWNGHHYGSFDVDPGGTTPGSHDWDDAVKYGFFSAGGGSWYSRTLSLLEVDDILWVQSPKHGYIGVGKVVSTSQPYEDFIVQVDGVETRLADCALKGNYSHPHSPDDDTREYFVGIKWLHVEALENAVKQVGFFGNQNSVCRPRAAKWAHTVNSLKSRWKVEVD
jgi:Holliday junction resolvase-like predicted endonuclease